jgi:hypothetical protein
MVRGSGHNNSAPLPLSSTEVPLETGNRADRSTGENIERRPLAFINVVAIPRIADVITTLTQNDRRSRDV